LFATAVKSARGKKWVAEAVDFETVLFSPLKPESLPGKEQLLSATLLTHNIYNTSAELGNNFGWWTYGQCYE
jgi:hypothetical protein